MLVLHFYFLKLGNTQFIINILYVRYLAVRGSDWCKPSICPSYIIYLCIYNVFVKAKIFVGMCNKMWPILRN